MVKKEEINSGEELYYVLQVYGVKISLEEAKKLWRKQSATRFKYKSYNEWSNETDIQNSTISTVLEVWQTTSNERIALWNSGNVRIYDPNKDLAYNYIDKGRKFIMPEGSSKGYFLMFELDKTSYTKLRDYFDFVVKNKDIRMLLYAHTFDALIQETLRSRALREEERRKYDEISKREIEEKEKQITAQEKRRALGEKYASTDSITVGNLIFTKDLLYVNDQKFGIIGINLREYFNKRAFLEYLTNLDEMVSMFINSLIRQISYVFEPYYLGRIDDSKTNTKAATVWLGSFSFEATYELGLGKSARFIDGRKITRDSFNYILPYIPKMESKDELTQMLDDLKKYPPSIREYMKSGLVMYAGEEKIPVTLLVTKQKNSLYFVYGEQLFHICGGVKTLNHLKSYSTHITRSKYEIFKELSINQNLPKDIVVSLINRAAEERTKAILKSQELINGMIAKYPERIAKAMFSPQGTDMAGYIIKGNKKDYFIDQKNLGVWSYPQGRYMCIVDKGQGHDFTHNDKLVTRMLLLLNDDKFENSMSHFR